MRVLSVYVTEIFDHHPLLGGSSHVALLFFYTCAILLSATAISEVIIHFDAYIQFILEIELFRLKSADTLTEEQYLSIFMRNLICLGSLMIR